MATISVAGVQNEKHTKRGKKFSISFPSVVTIEDNGEIRMWP